MNDWFTEQLQDELKLAKENELEPMANSEDYWKGVRYGINYALMTYEYGTAQGFLNNAYKALKAYQNANQCHNDEEALLFDIGRNALGE
jgi:hypothetical protein